jgi:hypothetical protein
LILTLDSFADFIGHPPGLLQVWCQQLYFSADPVNQNIRSRVEIASFIGMADINSDFFVIINGRDKIIENLLGCIYQFDYLNNMIASRKDFFYLDRE